MSAFIARGPLPPDSPLFRGRAAELARLSRLCQGELQAYATIYGGRQTGKTSLALRLLAQLELLGLAAEREGYWAARNPLLERALRTWVGSRP